LRRNAHCQCRRRLSADAARHLGDGQLTTVDSLSTAPLPDQFRLFAQGAARDGATTYDVICRGIADDPDILGLIGEAPVRQRRPNLLLAAVHFLLLGGAAHHPLADHYDTVRSFTGGVEAPPDAAAAHAAPPGRDLVADFKDFVMVHRGELLALIAVRSTQTNEVGRCTALLPALGTIAAGYPDGQPLRLLDLGTSAGLNLLFDSYAYTYRQRSDGTTLEAGRRGGPVHLECAVRGELGHLPPLLFPPIAGRTGIDAHPIDPTSDDGADWLLACLWPDNLPRFARLRGALSTARTTDDPPTVYRGDIIEDLPGVVEGIATDGPLVVFHSWVAAYLSPERQGQLVETVRQLSQARPLHYLYAEAPIETPGLPTPPSPAPGSTSHLATALVHVPPDGSPPVRLADMHHHGKWLQWWATPKDPTARHDGPAPALPRR
jgi:hypothetical protein